MWGFDYTERAAYFVTVCTKGKVCLFGDVAHDEMQLNRMGRIAREEWHRSEILRDDIVLDAFQIMPNHLHGIIVIVPEGADPTTACDPKGYQLPATYFSDSSVATQRAVSRPNGNFYVQPRSLGAVVRAFKSAVTRRINILRETPGAKVWQGNFHDHIIRNEREWWAIRQYIRTNSARWDADRYHPDRQTIQGLKV